MNPVVHFEIPADNVDRARKFYSDTFGWTITPVPEMSYSMVGTTPVGKDQRPTTPGAINGGMFQRGKMAPAPYPVVVINVPSIDASAKKIESKGGKIVVPKTAVGDMGHVAYFQDPEGNILGIWQDAKPTR